LRVPVPPNPSVPFKPVCTAVTDSSQVWPGMCSVSPANPNLVSFAGQAPVQHAKWSPDGTRIVFAYVIPGGPPTPPGDVPRQGIAIVDLPSSI
jgi:Tol biopolymer transport system component